MRILVPTRNSAPWIGFIAEGYRAIGLRPFYLVDDRSTDETLETLRTLGEECATFRPDGDFVEAGMIAAGVAHAGGDWILRVDDDEFPCAAVATFDTKALDPKIVYGLTRHEAVQTPQGIRLARWPATFCEFDGMSGSSMQYRLFHAPSVRFTCKVHSPGVEAKGQAALPPELFLTHFNCIIRSSETRLAKVRRYAGHDPQMSYFVAEESLPELCDRSTWTLRDIPDATTLDVAERLPKAPEGARPVFDSCEQAVRTSLLYNKGLGRNPVGALPVWAQHIAAEFVSTFARLSGSSRAKIHSEAIWAHLHRNRDRGRSSNVASPCEGRREGQLID